MVFENSAEQFRPPEAQHLSTAALLPSNSDYQNYFKLQAKTSLEPSFLDFGTGDIYRDRQTKLAQDVSGPMMPTLVPSPEQLGITPETTKLLANAAERLLKVLATDKPLAANEASLMSATTANNPQAWIDARAAFPQLNQVSEKLMQAYTRNEIANYDRLDLKDDLDAASGKLSSTPVRAADQATLGISQISPKGIREFEHKYPQFQQFLTSKGYTGPGHELAALLDPACAPMIVAAKTASLIDDLRAHGIEKPSNEQLAYGYNPDVFSFSNGHGGKEYKSLYQAQIKLMQIMHSDLKKEYYPTSVEITSKSAHVNNVMSKLK